jgi:hypothetical protein
MIYWPRRKYGNGYLPRQKKNGWAFLSLTWLAFARAIEKSTAAATHRGHKKKKAAAAKPGRVNIFVS